MDQQVVLLGKFFYKFSYSLTIISDYVGKLVDKRVQGEVVGTPPSMPHQPIQDQSPNFGVGIIPSHAGTLIIPLDS